MFDTKEILHNAFAVKKAYDSVWEPVMSRFSLTRVEIDVIAFLRTNPELDTSRCIVDYRMIAKSHVSKAVDSLMERGFITRTQDSDDKRLIHLRLTQKADEAADEIGKVQEEFAGSLSDGITEEERERFLAIASKIAANAEKMI